MGTTSSRRWCAAELPPEATLLHRGTGHGFVPIHSLGGEVAGHRLLQHGQAAVLRPSECAGEVRMVGGSLMAGARCPARTACIRMVDAPAHPSDIRGVDWRTPPATTAAHRAQARVGNQDDCGGPVHAGIAQVDVGHGHVGDVCEKGVMVCGCGGRQAARKPCRMPPSGAHGQAGVVQCPRRAPPRKRTHDMHAPGHGLLVDHGHLEHARGGLLVRGHGRHLQRREVRGGGGAFERRRRREAEMPLLQPVRGPCRVRAPCWDCWRSGELSGPRGART